MTNINKILITIVSCVFMVSVASVSIVSIVTSDEKETTTTTAPAPTEGQQLQVTEPATQASSQVITTQSTSALTTLTAPTQVIEGTTLTTTSVASSGDLATAILGKWTDSAGMSGFEFMEGGRVSCTYVDLAQFGVPFDGKASGLYTIEGDTLTIKFSIYTATIRKVYRATVNGNELSLYDLEEHETSTYAKAS